jgi:hypothetical protein
MVRVLLRKTYDPALFLLSPSLPTYEIPGHPMCKALILALCALEISCLLLFLITVLSQWSASYNFSFQVRAESLLLKYGPFFLLRFLFCCFLHCFDLVGCGIMGGAAAAAEEKQRCLRLEFAVVVFADLG